MKKFQLTALEYPMVDLIYTEVDDSTIDLLGAKKRDLTIIDSKRRKAIVEILSNRHLTKVPGGSLANALTVFSQLGGRAAFIGKIGDDELGKIALEDFQKNKINTDGIIVEKDLSTGLVVVATTKDAERTMWPSIEAGSRLKLEEINREVLAESEWLIIQSYLLPSSDSLKEIFIKIRKEAKELGCKLALGLSAPIICRQFEAELRESFSDFDLIFANEFEVAEFSKTIDPCESAKYLGQFCKHVVVTAGAAGVWINDAGDVFNVPASNCVPVDLTGAGDAFAGAYIFGLVSSQSKRESAKKANKIAGQVISQVGARLLL